MRTRSQSLASPPQSSSPAPAPKQQKRTAKSEQNPSDSDEPVTPRRQAKRVRFSDVSERPSSSGLTPALRRSVLHLETPQSSHQSMSGTRDRASLPTPDSSPLASVREIQFTPLKQVLDERIKRRLRRSHLSEEMNEFEHDRRSEARARRQTAALLREQVAQKEQQIGELLLEKEELQQRNIRVYDAEEKKMEGLELELLNLKQQLAKEHADDENDARVDFTSNINATNEDEISDANSLWDDSLVSSPAPSHHHTLSPSTQAVEPFSSPVMTDASTQATLQNDQYEAKIRELEQLVAQLTKNECDIRAAMEFVRNELHQLGFSTGQTDALESIISTIRDALRKTRLDLEYLLPGETPSGLTSGKTLLNSLITHIRHLLDKTKTTQLAIEVQQQSQNALRRQFNSALETTAGLKEALMQKSAEYEIILGDVLGNRTALIARVEEKEQELEILRDRLGTMQKRVDADAKRIEELDGVQKDSEEEHEVSVARLNAALERYREDVAGLEEMVRLLEQEKEDLHRWLQDSQLKVSMQEEKMRLVEEACISENAVYTHLERDLASTKAELEEAKAVFESDRTATVAQKQVHDEELAAKETRVRGLEQQILDAAEGFQEYKARVGSVLRGGAQELGVWDAILHDAGRV